MSANRRKQVENLFQEGMDLPVEHREKFLREQCGGDAALRAEVQALLDYDETVLRGFLNAPPLDLEGGPARAGNLPQRIGHYEVIRLIGEGGMGVVYEARQEHPARSVALKILRPRLATRDLLRRFQLEAEVLGHLQHPGIACIYEAGVIEGQAGMGLPERQPFFAMELIRGEPLDVYVRTHNVPLRKRLALLAEICDAVQHAHQKGVIHRDLKPGNILVDQSGRSKILDFGVARVTDADIRSTTLQTNVGQLVGTVAYMSPEQVGGDPRQLDTRSDVYALGIIGYELLTGALPQGLAKASFTEAVRRIREEDPEPLGRVNRALGGDVEIIVAKALEKDRDRRYASAAELAADLRRYLNDEPIAARRPSAIYHFRKLASRHRALTTSLALLFLILGVFGVWMSVLYRQADRLRLAADREAERARQTQLFLEKMLSSIDPEVAKGKDTSIIRGILTEAAEKVGTELAGQPEAQADIRATIGAAYLSVGLAGAAQTQLEDALAIRRRVLGGEHEAVAATLRLLAECAGKQGDRRQAEDLARQSLAIRRKQFGRDDVKVAEALQTLGWIVSELGGHHPEAAALFRESLDITVRIGGREQPLHAQGLHHLAVTLWRWQRNEKAESTARETLALKRKLYGKDHPSVASAMDLLGQILTSQQKYEAAEPLIRESVEMHRRLFGEDHPTFATALNSLCQLLMFKGDYEAAEPLARRCLDLVTRLRGEDSHETAMAWLNLAYLLDKKGDDQEAQRVYRIADERFRSVFPPDHPYVHSPLTRLAKMLDGNAEHESAEPLWRQLLNETRRAFPPGHTHQRIAASTAGGLGRCLFHLRRYEEAEKLLVDCYEGLRATPGARHKETISAARDLVRLYEANGSVEKAEPFRVILESDGITRPTARGKTGAGE